MSECEGLFSVRGSSRNLRRLMCCAQSVAFQNQLLRGLPGGPEGTSDATSGAEVHLNDLSHSIFAAASAGNAAYQQWPST